MINSSITMVTILNDYTEEDGQYFANDYNVLNTNDNSFIDFVNLYRELYNLRVKYSGMNITLTNPKYWPKINNGKSAIKMYLDGTNKKQYKDIEHFILQDFKKVMNAETSLQKDELIKLGTKIRKSQKLKIFHEMLREEYNYKPHLAFNIKHTDLIFTLNCWLTNDYAIEQIKALIYEKRKMNWLTGLSIFASLIFGLLCTFIGFYLSTI